MKFIYTFMLTTFALNTYAIEATTPSKMADGVALERIQAYSGSSTSSPKVGVIEPGTELIEFKNFLRTKPGLAIMEEPSKDPGVPFDRGAHVHIWEYLENGMSKVIINNIPYVTKVARSLEGCTYPPNVRYCWAKVLEEPEYYEWKQVALTHDGQKFWFLNRIIDGSGKISVKDEGIVQTRMLQTKYIEPTKPTTTADNVMKKDADIVETKKDNDILFQQEIMEDLELPEDPFERAMVERMLKPKSEIAKEEKEKRDAQLKQQQEEQKATTQPAEEIFKQQKLSDNSTLNANVENATANTLNQVNVDANAPAKKLELKANQPLTLE